MARWPVASRRCSRPDRAVHPVWLAGPVASAGPGPTSSCRAVLARPVRFSRRTAVRSGAWCLQEVAVGHSGARSRATHTQIEVTAVVHQHEAIDAVRRTVTRATRPALAPLRAAAASRLGQPDQAGGAASAAADEPDPRPSAPSAGLRDELAAMRDELTAGPDPLVDDPSDRAQRATRSASAYLEARRARLKRELRELRELP